MKRLFIQRYLISYIFILLCFLCIFKGFRVWGFRCLLHFYAILVQNCGSHSDNPIHFKLPYRLVQRFGCHMDIPIHGGFDAAVSQQLLQHFGLHPAFNRPRGVGVAQRVHTKAPNSRFVAELVEVGVIGAILCRFSGTPVDKDQITHHQLCHAAASTIHVLQSLLQHRRRFSFFPTIPHFAEDIVGRVCQRNGAVAVGRFGRSCPPRFCTVPELPRLVHRQRPFLEINGIPVRPISSPVRSPVSRINAY